MLDHPITVVLNVFDTLKNNGLKVYMFTRGDPEIRGKRSPFLHRLTNRAEN